MRTKQQMEQEAAEARVARTGETIQMALEAVRKENSPKKDDRSQHEPTDDEDVECVACNLGIPIQNGRHTIGIGHSSKACLDCPVSEKVYAECMRRKATSIDCAACKDGQLVNLATGEHRISIGDGQIETSECPIYKHDYEAMLLASGATLPDENCEACKIGIVFALGDKHHIQLDHGRTTFSACPISKQDRERLEQLGAEAWNKAELKEEQVGCEACRRGVAMIDHLALQHAFGVRRDTGAVVRTDCPTTKDEYVDAIRAVEGRPIAAPARIKREAPTAQQQEQILSSLMAVIHDVAQRNANEAFDGYDLRAVHHVTAAAPSHYNPISFNLEIEYSMGGRDPNRVPLRKPPEEPGKTSSGYQYFVPEQSDRTTEVEPTTTVEEKRKTLNILRRQAHKGGHNITGPLARTITNLAKDIEKQELEYRAPVADDFSEEPKKGVHAVIAQAARLAEELIESGTHIELPAAALLQELIGYLTPFVMNGDKDVVPQAREDHLDFAVMEAVTAAAMKLHDAGTTAHHDDGGVTIDGAVYREFMRTTNNLRAVGRRDPVIVTAKQKPMAADNPDEIARRAKRVELGMDPPSIDAARDESATAVVEAALQIHEIGSAVYVSDGVTIDAALYQALMRAVNKMIDHGKRAHEPSKEPLDRYVATYTACFTVRDLIKQAREFVTQLERKFEYVAVSLVKDMIAALEEEDADPRPNAITQRHRGDMQLCHLNSLLFPNGGEGMRTRSVIATTAREEITRLRKRVPAALGRLAGRLRFVCRVLSKALTRVELGTFMECEGDDDKHIEPCLDIIYGKEDDQKVPMSEHIDWADDTEVNDGAKKHWNEKAQSQEQVAKRGSSTSLLQAQASERTTNAVARYYDTRKTCPECHLLQPNHHENCSKPEHLTEKEHSKERAAKEDELEKQRVQAQVQEAEQKEAEARGFAEMPAYRQHDWDTPKGFNLTSMSQCKVCNITWTVAATGAKCSGTHGNNLKE